MKIRDAAFAGLAALLALGALAWLAIAAFHFWTSLGPPVPQPRDVFATRGLVDLGIALVLGAAAWATLRYWRRIPRKN
jgi:hypothetical protein